MRGTRWTARGVFRFLAGAALACAVGVSAERACAAPELSLSGGSTLAIVGEPGEGGASISAGLLWPFDAAAPIGERMRFGVHLFADDLGARISRLLDPNDQTDLGLAEDLHRDAFGAAWRMDAVFDGPGAWLPYTSGTWGFYWVQDDVRGESREAVGSTGFSLGAGLMRPIAGASTLGVGARYHRLFNDVAARYVSLSAEWRWGGAFRR
jgi:hypothetical protein